MNNGVWWWGPLSSADQTSRLRSSMDAPKHSITCSSLVIFLSCKLSPSWTGGCLPRLVTSAGSLYCYLCGQGSWGVVVQLSICVWTVQHSNWMCRCAHHVDDIQAETQRSCICPLSICIPTAIMCYILPKSKLEPDFSNPPWITWHIFLSLFLPFGNFGSNISLLSSQDTITCAHWILCSPGPNLQEAMVCSGTVWM